FMLIAGGVGAIAVVAIGAFLILGKGGGHKTTTDNSDAAQLIDKGTAPVNNARTPVAYPSPVATTRGAVSEHVDSTILVATSDSDCYDKSGGCQLIYAVGPYRFRGHTLRIEFTLQVIAPAGKGVSWVNDMKTDADAKASGVDGVQLEGESG